MVGVSDLFPGWADEGELGAGSYGSVKRVAKKVGGVTMRRAVKLVPVPHDRAEAEAVRRATGKGDESLRTYFEHYAREMMGEVAAMEGLRGCPQVVTVDDCQMIPDPDGVGWFVGIMMELLEPVDALMGIGPAGQAEVSRLGADVARALEACHALGIVHRDVKPSNVLTDGRGVYKLGDFGIARVMSEGTTGELSRRGTPSYMAPEEVHGEGYGPSVDLYALGVMLYRMLNGGRQPFLEMDPLNATPRDMQRAEMRRLSGEAFPEIVGVDPSLMSMVLRMCEADPTKRPTDAEARAELEACVVSLSNTIPASKARRRRRSTPKGGPEGQATTAGADDVMLPGGTLKRPTPVPAPSRSTSPAGESTVLASDDTWEAGWVSAPTEKLTEADPVAETKPRAKVEPQDKAKPRSKDQPRTETKPRVEAEPLVETEPPVEAEPSVGADQQVRTESSEGRAAGEGASRRGTQATRRKGIRRKILTALAVVYAIVFVIGSAWGITNALKRDGIIGDTSDMTAPETETEQKGDGATSATSETTDPAAETGQKTLFDHDSPFVGRPTLGSVLSYDWSSFYEDDESADFVAVSAGEEHAVFLRSDGTALAVGRNPKGQGDVSEWTNVVAVSAGSVHTVGLRSDGTVLAVGDNEEGECDVSDWTDVVAVATGYQRTLGLRGDGTVLTAGSFDEEYDFSDWTDIVAIAAGDYHMVGLRSDGTVVATGSNYFYRRDVSDWSDVVAVSAGLYTTVGLRSDGTVLATGPNTHGECDVSGWTDIVEIAAGGFHTVGLRSDGTVVATGSNGGGRSNVSGWTGVAHIAAGEVDTVAVKSDGSILQCGPSSKYYHFSSN